MTAPKYRSPAELLLRQSVHVLFVGLLVMGVVQSFVRDARPPWAAALAVAVLGWYSFGVLLARSRRDRSTAAMWIAVLIVGLLGLLAVSA